MYRWSYMYMCIYTWYTSQWEHSHIMLGHGVLFMNMLGTSIMEVRSVSLLCFGAVIFL